MPRHYTFELQASVTVFAESEEEAHMLLDNLTPDEDSPLNGGSVYIPPFQQDVKLVDVSASD